MQCIHNMFVFEEDSRHFKLAGYKSYPVGYSPTGGECYTYKGTIDKDTGDVEFQDFSDVDVYRDFYTAVHIGPDITSHALNLIHTTDEKPSEYLPSEVEEYFELREQEGVTYTDYVAPRTGKLKSDFNTCGWYIKLRCDRWSITITPIERYIDYGPIFWGVHYDDHLVSFYIEPEGEGDGFEVFGMRNSIPDGSPCGVAQLIPTSFGAIVAVAVTDSPGHLFVVKDDAPRTKAASKQ